MCMLLTGLREKQNRNHKNSVISNFIIPSHSSIQHSINISETLFSTRCVYNLISPEKIKWLGIFD